MVSNARLYNVIQCHTLFVLSFQLKQSGIDINKSNEYGDTALNWASNCDHSGIIELLLQQPGINVNQAANDGNTALIVASFKGHTEIVKLLLQQPEMIQ
jgi:ankyrin repeat protein